MIKAKLYILTFGRTRKFTPSYKGGGGGVGGWKPTPKFWKCCNISKRFYLYWKAFDLLNKMMYILWMVALLEACGVTNNGRRLRIQRLIYKLMLLSFFLFRKNRQAQTSHVCHRNNGVKRYYWSSANDKVHRKS